MSHFAEMEVCYQQKSEKELVAALETQFGKGNVEVHEDGAALMGYHGDNRANLAKTNPNYAPPCHLIIRRKHIGSASNDIGYRRTEDGGYVAYISEYDQSSTFTKKKQGLVTQDYSLRVSEKQLKMKGYSFKKVAQKDGTIKLIGTKFA